MLNLNNLLGIFLNSLNSLNNLGIQKYSKFTVKMFDRAAPVSHIGVGNYSNEIHEEGREFSSGNGNVMNGRVNFEFGIQSIQSGYSKYSNYGCD